MLREVETQQPGGLLVSTEVNVTVLGKNSLKHSLEKGIWVSRSAEGRLPGTNLQASKGSRRGREKMLSKDVVSSTTQFCLTYETPDDTSYSRIVPPLRQRGQPVVPP